MKPGTGVTVGVVDTGIDESHFAFDGKTVREEFFQGAVDEDGSKSSHGTAVASVIAATPPPQSPDDFFRCCSRRRSPRVCYTTQRSTGTRHPLCTKLL